MEDDAQTANEDGVLVGAETGRLVRLQACCLTHPPEPIPPLLRKCRGVVLIFNFLPLVEYMRTVWRSTGANISLRIMPTRIAI
jgi:hypothetical protein